MWTAFFNFAIGTLPVILILSQPDRNRELTNICLSVLEALSPSFHTRLIAFLHRQPTDPFLLLYLPTSDTHTHTHQRTHVHPYLMHPSINTLTAISLSHSGHNNNLFGDTGSTSKEGYNFSNQIAIITLIYDIDDDNTRGSSTIKSGLMIKF